MNTSCMLKVIETHTAGNPTRHIVSGVPRISGETMGEKMQYVVDHLDWVRRVTMMEPRGRNGMSGCIYTEPCNPEADMGIVYFDAAGYLTMCGHSTIAISTVLVETGIVRMTEPVTTVKLDTPAGLIVAKVFVKDGQVEKVTFRNIPAFLYDAREIDIGALGKVRVEVDYGGVAYAVVNAKDIGIEEISPKNLSEIVEKAHLVYAAASREIGFQHPEKPFINRITSVMIVGDPDIQGADNKEVVVIMPLTEGDTTAVDRSPCGTGTSARVGSLFVQGKLKENTPFVHESIIGTCFTAEIVGKAKVGDFPAGIPEITGSAYFTASTDFFIDPRDPLKNGFSMD
ncbi:MAG: proline racemase [Ruminococcaceae bacterium]|nr:proline racemase [Oscillospiraceae bacterium]